MELRQLAHDLFHHPDCLFFGHRRSSQTVGVNAETLDQLETASVAFFCKFCSEHIETVPFSETSVEIRAHVVTLVLDDQEV